MSAIDYAPGIADQAQGLARKILDVIDDKHLLWVYDPDGDQLSKYDKFMDNCLSSEGPATAMLAFWRGRTRGLW